MISGISALRMAVLTLGLAAMAAPEAARAWPQEVGPFAYVPFFYCCSDVPGGVSVIDTHAKTTAGPPVAPGYVQSAAVRPDGEFVYVLEGYSVAGSTGETFFPRGAVTVIDARTNTQAARVTLEDDVPNVGDALAVTPDGKFIYVAGADALDDAKGRNIVRMIDTTTNKVVGSPIVISPVYLGSALDILVTPDGKRVYVLFNDGARVIDTASNTLVGTLIPIPGPTKFAVMPDGKRIYVSSTEFIQSSFSYIPRIVKIDTASNTLAGPPIALKDYPGAIVVAPDGKHVFVVTAVARNEHPYRVQTIDTATDAVAEPPIEIGSGSARGIAMTPDDKFVYVPVFQDDGKAFVSIIDAASRKVTATTPLPAEAFGEDIAIVPAPPGLPFDSVKIAGLSIDRSGGPKHGWFNYYAYLTLGAGNDGIHPDVEPVTLILGGYAQTIPPGSFKKLADGSYSLFKWVNGVFYNASIKPQGGALYLVHLSETQLTLPEFANPVQVRLIVGNDAGLVTVKATLN